MNFRAALVVCLSLIATLPAAAQWRAAPTEALPPRIVMTWVPPYAVAASYTRLRALYGNVGPRNALTHIGLQFWIPTASGGLQRTTDFEPITNAVIRTFVNWGHANGIKVELCVFNYVNAKDIWDWTLARKAFGPNRDKFVTALVAQMTALGLDGIDIDFEGNGSFDRDKPAYVAFINELATRVHALGKQVTVDSFEYVWDAPNQHWWASLFPLVDGITSMGYGYLARAAPERYFRFSTQKAVAGVWSRKLLIGLPSDLSDWKGNTAAQQAAWFNTAAAGRVGVAIWDAQDQADAWRAAPVWRQLKAVRTDPN